MVQEAITLREFELPGQAPSRSRLPVAAQAGTCQSLIRDGGSLACQITLALETMAPDLKGHRLAEWYVDAIIRKLGGERATIHDFESRGRRLFYGIGCDVLGPVAVRFVDAAMTGFAGHLIFPGRDADPFYTIALTLYDLDSTRYPLPREHLHNPLLNRRLLGIADEQCIAGGQRVERIAVDRLLRMVGFDSGIPVRIVDVGCWGTIIDALKRRYPRDDLSVYFLFSHLPHALYGYLNDHGRDLSLLVLETIADSWEAVPKRRLSENPRAGDAVTPDKLRASRLLESWADALLLGLQAAARRFVRGAPIGERNRWDRQVTVAVEQLAEMVAATREGGPFCGLLPRNTQTWSGGKAWTAAWTHGAVPPLIAPTLSCTSTAH